MLVFSCFSYPGSVLPIKVLFVIYMAIVARYQKNILFVPERYLKMRINVTGGTIAMITLVICALIHLAWHMKKLTDANQQWRMAVKEVSKNNTAKALERYSIAFPLLKNNGAFVAMYGHALMCNRRYDCAIELLNRATKLQPTTNVYLDLADCYRQLDQLETAERYYLYALQMIPSRIKPVYKLAKLYLDAGRSGCALQVINHYLEMNTKKRTLASFELEYELIEMRKLILGNIDNL